MKKIAVLHALMILSSWSFSQTVIDRIYIKGGSAAMDEFKKVIYRYPAFQDGMVEFKNGGRFKRPMNYNKIASTIEFINEKNDTLAFAEEGSVNYVSIGTDTYIFMPACLQYIASGKVKFYKYEKMKVGDVQKIGAYGIPNTGSSIDTYNRIDTEQRSYDIDVNETIILSRAISFLVETKNNVFLPVTRKNIMKLFSENESQIKTFIRDKNISFTKEEDLVELANYISSL